MVQYLSRYLQRSTILKKILAVFFILYVTIGFFPLNANAEGFEFPYSELKGDSIHMIDTNTNKVIYSQNPDERRPVASISKIMTFIVVYENFADLESTKITYTQEATNILYNSWASVAGLYIGEEFTALELLYLMLIPSGGDAALQFALYYDSLQGYTSPYVSTDEYGVDSRAYDMSDSPFVQLMNETAKRLGCEDTNFTNPVGLHHEDNYSTARDISTITMHAKSLPYFDDIVSTVVYKSSPTQFFPNGRDHYSTNSLFSEYLFNGRYYLSSATGIKTGTLKESGACAVTSAENGDYAYMVVSLGSEIYDEFGNSLGINGAMEDSKRLYEWAFSSLSKYTAIEKGELLSEVNVKYSWGNETVQLISQDNVIALLPNNVSSSNLDFSVNPPEFIEAPVTAGDVITQADVYYNGSKIATVNAVAKESLGRSEFLKISETVINVVTSAQFIWTVVAVIVIVWVYILLLRRHNRLKKISAQKAQQRKNRNS